MLPVMGCSSLLGIENPSPGSNRIDGGVEDAVDAPSGDHLLFSTGDFQLAQLQSVRVHVVFVHAGGAMEDVTSMATYGSDNEPVVTIGGLGVINSADTQSGSATITASLTGAIPATVRATVKTTLCHPVINELQTAGSASAADEWVEIYNPCTAPMSVNGWTLDYRGANIAGTSDSNLMFTLTGQMMPGELRLLAGIDHAGPNDGQWTVVGGFIGKTDGAVGLRSGVKDTGPLVDAIAYGAVAAGHPFLQGGAAAPAMAVDVSVSRLPFDGKDDDNSMVDFKTTTSPTPRALNAP
jgi:hypothetical protein